MTGTPLHMWHYWSRKVGIVAALEGRYPELLQDNFELRVAFANYVAAAITIDKIMANLAEIQDKEKAQ